MKVGSPKEIKNHEYRVGLIPPTVTELKKYGHEVFIQSEAGLGVGFSDNDYKAAGAKIFKDSRSIFEECDIIVKVKEPQKEERRLLRPEQILFTYLHLAPDRSQTEDLIERKVTAIAYETVTDNNGGLPLLAPMSEVAGKLAPQAGSWALQKANGGSGILLGGVSGVLPANVLVIGGGVVGTNAARVAFGMGANVTILDKSLKRLAELESQFSGQVKTCYASGANTLELSTQADMIIGAVLVPGAEAPKLISKTQLSKLKKGSVLVDVAIDQGGCFETSSPTTHDSPIYEVNGIIHYCVANMPGAVARTSTIALSNAVTPYLMQLTNKGWAKACFDNPHLKNGLSIHDGMITNEAVAQSFGKPYVNPDQLINADQFL